MASIQENIKKTIVKILPKSLVQFIEQEHTNKDIYLYRNVSFSQEGEDLILNRLLQEKQNGFYVDIGAHHPLRFSNTHLFYMRGWRGINIDPLVNGMEIFDSVRSEDINLELAVSSSEKKEKYYVFSDNAYNTLSEDIARSHMGKVESGFVAEKEILCMPLESILDKYVENGKQIDFMSIDVEGHELQVLESNNWSKYQPNYLLLEMYATFIEDIYLTKTHTYLSNLKYKLVARTPNTSLYKFSA